MTALAQTGNVSKAAEEAGVNRCTPYDYRRAHPDFAAAWNNAEQAACDALELEARRRAHDGVDKPIVYQGELMGLWVDASGQPVNKDTPGARQIPLTVKEYSDTLLIFLLKAHRPDKYWRPTVAEQPSRTPATDDKHTNRLEAVAFYRSIRDNPQADLAQRLKAQQSIDRLLGLIEMTPRTLENICDQLGISMESLHQMVAGHIPTGAATSTDHQPDASLPERPDRIHPENPEAEPLA